MRWPWGTDEALLFDLNDAGLTIGRGITIDAGAADSEFAAEGSTIENLGTLEDNTASSRAFLRTESTVTQGHRQRLRQLLGRYAQGRHVESRQRRRVEHLWI